MILLDEGFIVGKLVAASHHDRGVGAVVAQIEELFDTNALSALTVVDQMRTHTIREQPQSLFVHLLVDRRVHQRARFLFFVDQIRHPDTVRTQDASVSVNENLSNAQSTSDGARMLTTCTTETREDMIRRVVTLSFSERSDRTTHGLVGHADETQRHLFDGETSRHLLGGEVFVDLGGESDKASSTGVGVQRLIFVRPENVRKVVGQDTTQHQVGVGDGQLTAFLAVAHRTGMSTGALRPDMKLTAAEGQQRSTTCCHRNDVQLRSLDRHSGHHRVVDMLQLTCVATDVGTCSSHIESDYWLGSLRIIGGGSTTYQTTSGATEDRLEAGKVLNSAETTVAHHERGANT
mmetsp:Transcript_24709/g.61985  ORF Transcript_24709/g.61985 Transcript_24709/m.61985 type:complete len:348 (-) Transcript_24709:923-1966(-)